MQQASLGMVTVVVSEALPNSETKPPDSVGRMPCSTIGMAMQVPIRYLLRLTVSFVLCRFPGTSSKLLWNILARHVLVHNDSAMTNEGTPLR